jgi:hypothetical protein
MSVLLHPSLCIGGAELGAEANPSGSKVLTPGVMSGGDLKESLPSVGRGGSLKWSRFLLHAVSPCSFVALSKIPSHDIALSSLYNARLMSRRCNLRATFHQMSRRGAKKGQGLETKNLEGNFIVRAENCA